MAADNGQRDNGLDGDEGLYRALAESSQEIIFLINREGGVRYVNAAAASFFRAPREEIEGRNLGELFSPEACELQSRALRQVFQSGEPVYAEENLSFADRRIWLETRLMPIKGRDGSVEYVMGVSRDVTDRKKTELALRESEQTARTLLDIPTAAALLIDREGICLAANETMARRFGWNIPDIIGKPIWSFFPPEVSARRKAYLAEVLRTKKQVRFEDERQGRWNDIVATPVLDDNGDVSKVAVFGFDVTERKRTEERLKQYQDRLEELVDERTKELSLLNDQLRQSQKMEAVGLLAGGIAHDFSNILTVIKGAVYLMRRQLPSDSPLTKYTDRIVTSLSKATNLSHSLLAFSRRQTIDLRPVRINDIIRRTTKLLSQLIGEHIELAVTLAGEDPSAKADINQIEQVLVNLATNARDAMPGGGTLTVRSEIAAMDESFVKTHGYGQAGQYVLISVSDTGTGIAEGLQEKIFEPFFTTKALGKGSGLGLAVTYGIVKQHNGFIDVTSPPGQGTTFRIYIPMTESQPSESGRSDPPPAAGGHETILLAEDDPNTRMVMAEVLRTNGYTVLEAEDGNAAVRILLGHGGEIQLAILDVRMPKKNGREVYEEIRRTRPATKVLFMSGYAADVIDSEMMSEQDFNFISKTAFPEEILRKIREVLEG